MRSFRFFLLKHLKVSVTFVPFWFLNPSTFPELWDDGRSNISASTLPSEEMIQTIIPPPTITWMLLWRTDPSGSYWVIFPSPPPEENIRLLLWWMKVLHQVLAAADGWWFWMWNRLMDQRSLHPAQAAPCRRNLEILLIFLWGTLFLTSSVMMSPSGCHGYLLISAKLVRLYSG